MGGPAFPMRTIGPSHHRVAALGHLEKPEECAKAVSDLLLRKPYFSCTFALKRLFYVKDGGQLELYLEGLRRVGIPE